MKRPKILNRQFEGEKTMKTNIRFAKMTSLALLVATLTIYTANRMETAVNAAPATAAQTELTEPSTDIEFGGINLAQTQNALIIVVCAKDPTGRDQRPVEVEFMLCDWEGNLLGSETKTILPGRASSFDIRGIRVPGRASELMPCVKVLCDPSDPRAKRITATLQVTDDSGKVQSLVCRKAGGDSASAGSPF
jgi:hypothetical protein